VNPFQIELSLLKPPLARLDILILESWIVEVLETSTADLRRDPSPSLLIKEAVEVILIAQIVEEGIDLSAP